MQLMMQVKKKEEEKSAGHAISIMTANGGNSEGNCHLRIICME